MKLLQIGHRHHLLHRTLRLRVSLLSHKGLRQMPDMRTSHKMKQRRLKFKRIRTLERSNLHLYNSRNRWTQLSSGLSQSLWIRVNLRQTDQLTCQSSDIIATRHLCRSPSKTWTKTSKMSMISLCARRVSLSKTMPQNQLTIKPSWELSKGLRDKWLQIWRLFLQILI